MHASKLMTALTMSLAAVSGAHAASYTFTTIDAPGGTGTALFGLNDAGTVVGDTDTGAAVYSRVPGFVYSAGTFTPVALPSTVAGVTGPVSAVGINNAGTITGSYHNSTLPSVPGTSATPGKEVGYTLNGTAVSTLNVNSFDTQPRGLNETGAVVGRVEGPSPGSIGAFATQNGATLGVSPVVPHTGLYNFVNYNGINDAGDIVLSFTNDVQQSALYKGGVTTLLSDPAGFSTAAFGINNADAVVGGYSSGTAQNGFFSNIVQHGFVYANGTYSTVDVPGASATTIRDINNLGVIVGDYIDPNGVDHGFIGTLEDPTGTTVPEPSSAALIGLAVLGLAAYGTRRTRRDEQE